MQCCYIAFMIAIYYGRRLSCNMNPLLIGLVKKAASTPICDCTRTMSEELYATRACKAMRNHLLDGSALESERRQSSVSPNTVIS